MISRLSLLATAGALLLVGGARAADTHRADLQAIDTYLTITGTGAASAPAGRPATDKLAPLDARVVALGGGSAIVYYTVDDRSADKVRVVTTVGTDADGAAPSARFVSYLAAGQKAEVSVAGAVGTEAASLELAYNGAFLTVRPTPARLEG